MAATGVSVRSAAAFVRLRARRGLTIYFGMLVVLSAVFQSLIIETGNWTWVIPLMWSPAAASMVARLVLHDGCADISFRVGGRRGWQAILVAATFPIVIGLTAYGVAWTTDMTRFIPQPDGLATHLGADSRSPVAAFLIMLAVSATIGTVMGILTAAGEEIGWRGYMLTRLIDAGTPRPILVSGLIWGLWHVPVVLGAGYAAGPSPAVSAVLLVTLTTAFGSVFARLRLETGSVWPAIILHAAWNSIIQSAFDEARSGGDGSWWVGESGVLTVATLIISAVIFSRGRWTILAKPAAQDTVDATTSAAKTYF